MRVRSPAKINLFLHVTGRREDGYHELESLMVCLDLADEIDFDFNTEGIRITCADPQVPCDETNLACRAAKVFLDRFSRSRPGGVNPPGVGMSIRKHIPVGGGLGGGSSNAATVLSTLNRRFNAPFSGQELMAMGLELGADVPFFIQGGAAIARGIGEQLSPCPMPEKVHVLLASPGISAATARVYKNLNLGLTTRTKSTNNALIIACEEGRILDFRDRLHNDLETSACALYPDLMAFKEEMSRLLTQRVMMTGSGSSFFALFRHYEAAAEACRNLTREWKEDARKTVCLTAFQ